MLRLLGVAAVSSYIAPVFGRHDFSNMRVKELKAFLADRNADCFGCAEKHEFVAKALEVCETPAKPKSKPKQHPSKSESDSKAGSKPRPKKESAPLKAPGDIHACIWLFFTLAVLLLKCVAGHVRQVYFRMWRLVNGEQCCVFTLSPIRCPYFLPCCKKVCERSALATWAQKSRYFRKRDEIEFERVAPCPHCRKMLEPAAVRGLLGQYMLGAPLDGDYALDSGVVDPAYPHGAAHHNFLLLKTSKELDEERHQFHAPQEMETHLDDTDNVDVEAESERSIGSDSECSDHLVYGISSASLPMITWPHCAQEDSSAVCAEADQTDTHEIFFCGFQRGFLC